VTETLTMGQRHAGQATIEELLAQHRSDRARSLAGRIFGRSPLGPESAERYRHAQAQLAVGELLERLPPEWTVISSAPPREGHPGIDHVVLGPSGIFTISSKLHKDKKVWVADSILVADGHTHPDIPETERHARRVTTILESRMPLPAPVHPIVAVVDAKQITIREQPQTVHVMDAWEVRPALVSAPAVLDAGDLHQIRAILDDPESWGLAASGSAAGAGAGGTASHADQLLAEFRALDAEVRSAEARRARWKLAAYGVAVITPIAAFPFLVELVRGITGS
jgi:hypothetical protein